MENDRSFSAKIPAACRDAAGTAADGKPPLSLSLSLSLSTSHICTELGPVVHGKGRERTPSEEEAQDHGHDAMQNELCTDRFQKEED